jgi:SiaC family regulatory phosphoprotein
MEALDIKATNDTPRVFFDPDNDIFEISGRSLPEDVVSFYQPILDWLDEYKLHPLKKTEFIFKYIYFNTATSKLVQDILVRLESLKVAGIEVNIMWYYEQDDEDMYEIGQEFKENLDLPFEIIAY